MARLNAKELRKSVPSSEETSGLPKNPIYLVLDNIIDTYNIGSLFRLADATGITKMYLCGNMEYPPSSKIHKAAVGTENWVQWEKADSTLEIVKKLKSEGAKILVIEQSKNSVSYKNFKPEFPLALVVGNETKGVNQKVLDMADTIVELPMFGINKSFNVWGATAVVAYKILESI